MSKIRIVTDSSITIEPELVEKYNITVVPLSVMVDGVIYSDSDLREEGRFLDMMKHSKELPKTSQPPVGLFAETYEKLVKEGAEQIVAIHIMHTLSGTCEASRQGASLSGADVTVIDSGFTDQCLKFQVVEAAKLAEAGASLDEIVARVEEVKSKSELHIGVSTLENLVKGGRIGRVTGLLSSLLNIRVIMELKDYQLNTIAKGRGARHSQNGLSYINGIKDRKVAEIGISYAGTPDFAHEMAEKLGVLGAPISILETGSIIQTHTGEVPLP